MNKLQIHLNGGEKYTISMSLEQLEGVITTDEGKLKNELVRIERYIINPTHISSILEKDSSSAKFLGV
ncbi:hypothetical protein P9Y62_30260 [Bacillus thuringiensis]|uniref:LytTR family transcriptional regulator DNA-binding domain-containing protein n=2 Tax=Bacillus cereus group TaxID=86661 RepID=A0AAW5KXV2_BACCE|nr:MULTISPECIES: hypothetical protein [Bacillus cereus group]EEM38036.1 hypothetical protein bthur0004_61150 [Bacillus thuringiensis serovar sotto str. T04001]AFQ18174.1 hypothetical protein BTG_23810 [Bacillus thuringiensis HD-771]MCQ6285857.1 LytTR family transcriptional regulator DNA-binding domain-containing protein [Bacillus cereus]MCQ6314651.1 LytTR family transcriptional regulator DNA-binding domain-containing protein [Bacillus cereus]MCQ6329151.1 LytTR family transcriptional regulator 